MMSVYRLFTTDIKKDSLDLSEEAALQYYVFESTGKNPIGLERQPNGKYNGYAVGKHAMDVTVAIWIQDIMECLLFIWELYEDPIFKDVHWWLDKAVKAPIIKKLESGEKLNLWFLPQQKAGVTNGQKDDRGS